MYSFTTGIGRHSKFTFVIRDQWNKLVMSAGSFENESLAQLEAIRYVEMCNKVSSSVPARTRNTDKFRNSVRSLLY